MQFTWELCAILGIKQNLSTAYHLQMDGQSEHVNQWVKQYLCIYSNMEQNDWASLLPMAQFIHNSWVNDSTWAIPFALLYGHTSTLQLTTHKTNLLALT